MSSSSDTTTGGRDEFLAALIINAAIGIVAIIAFSILRRRLTWRFDIRRVDHARNAGYRPGDAFLERPPQQSRSFFGWAPTIYNITESQMLKIAGVDAVVILRYFKHMCFFFIYMCLLSWTIVVPVTISGDAPSSIIGIDIFSMANIPERSHKFIAHLCVTWAFTFFMFYIIAKMWIENIRMRSKWAASEQLSGRQMTIFVEQIPQQYRSDKKFQTLVENLFPNAISGAQLLRHTGKIASLSERRDWLINTINNLRGMQELNYKNNHEPYYHNAKFCRKSTRVESIPAYSQELEEVCEKLNEILQEAQESEENEKKLLPYSHAGFISFKSVMPYSAASVIPMTSEPGYLVARPAPEPRDLYWPGLLKHPMYRLIVGWLMNVATFFLVFFYSIPVGFIASLTTLEYLSDKLPFLEPILDLSPAIRAFLQGFLPSLATIIFMALLPIILKAMAILQGTESFSWINISILKRYFIFQLFNFFLISCLSSAVFRQIQEIIDNPTSIVPLLARSLPSTALGFITYTMIRAFSTNLLDLIGIPDIVIPLIKWFFAGTPSAYLDAWKPPPFPYGKLIPESLLIGIVGFCFGIIQPVIMPFTALYFFTLYFVHKYLFAYVHVTPFETGGKFFPLLANRLLFGIGVAQLTVLGVIALKKLPVESALMVPLPFLTFAFYYFTNSHLQPIYDYTSITSAVRSDYARSQLTQDERRALIAGVNMCSVAEGILPILVDQVYGDCVSKDKEIRKLLQQGDITQEQADELWSSYGMFPKRDKERQERISEFQQKFERNFEDTPDGVFGLFSFEKRKQLDFIDEGESTKVDPTYHQRVDAELASDRVSSSHGAEHDVDLHDIGQHHTIEMQSKDGNNIDPLQILYNSAIRSVGGDPDAIDISPSKDTSSGSGSANNDNKTSTDGAAGPLVNGRHLTIDTNVPASNSLVGDDLENHENLVSPSKRLNARIQFLSPRSLLAQEENCKVALARYVQAEMAPEVYAPKLTETVWPKLYINYYILKKTKKQRAKAAKDATKNGTDGHGNGITSTPVVHSSSSPATHTLDTSAIEAQPLAQEHLSGNISGSGSEEPQYIENTQHTPDTQHTQDTPDTQTPPPHVPLPTLPTRPQSTPTATSTSPIQPNEEGSHETVDGVGNANTVDSIDREEGKF